MKMYIYKTTNLLNGKIYIGQHIDKSKKIDNYLGSGTILQLAIKKYGENNFRKEILEYCEYSDKLNSREVFWISEYKSTNLDIGYNLTDGGDKYLMTDEIKNKISNTIKERGTSKGKNNPMYGVEFTDERKEKYIKTRKENYHNHKYKTKEYRDKISKITTGENNPNYNNKWSKDKKEKISKYLKDNGVHSGEKNSSFGKYGKYSHGYKPIPKNIGDNILYDYKNNFINISKLSKKYDISELRITNFILDNGLKIKRIFFSDENIEKIKVMYLEKHMTFNEIGKIIGTDYRNIKKLLNQIL
jgi:group I intron endonuclease